MDPDYIKKVVEIDIDESFINQYISDWSISNNMTISPITDINAAFKSAEKILMIQSGTVRSFNPQTNKYDDKLDKDSAMELIGNIVANTIFSNSDSESNMKLFYESIRQEVINKCNEILDSHSHLLGDNPKESIIKFCKQTRKSAKGTSLKGYLYVPYESIVEVFGEPLYGSSGDNKIDWEWVISYKNTLFTIYNYKDGPSYTKNRRIKPEDIQDWHIGGFTYESIKVLKEIFGDEVIAKV